MSNKDKLIISSILSVQNISIIINFYFNYFSFGIKSTLLIDLFLKFELAFKAILV